MAEPQLKPEDEIQPFLRSIPGGGQTTPNRGNLEAVPEYEPNDELSTRRKLYEQELNPEKLSDESIANQEANSSYVTQGPWSNKVSENKKITQKNTPFSIAEKKGPLTAIILTLVGGCIGIAGLLSPSLLLVQIKETLVTKFDSQFEDMDARSKKLLAASIGASKTTTGALCSTLNIACRYSTMSDKEVANFKEAGIEIEVDPENSSTIFGRTKPKAFTFKGNTIGAGEFSSELSSNPEFRAALQKAYNPKYSGFADAIWAKVAAKLGISKKAADISGKTDEERLAKIEEDTKNPSKADEITAKDVTTKDTNPETGQPYSQAEADAANAKAAAAAADANKITEAAAATEKSGIKAVDSVGTDIGKVAETARNSISIDGIAQFACTTYGVVEGVGYAAKTVRAVQLVRYAMIFLNVADQIKAGTAKPEDVSYLGKILTSLAVMKTTTDINGVTTKVMGSATDSIGYRFAAFGDKNISSDSLASQFMAGGGLTGDILYIVGMINNTLGNNPRKICGIVQNPFVQGGSLIAGIASFFVPGANIAISAKDIAQGVGIAALQIASSFLPALLQDIVAGVLVDKNTVGAASGDAIVSGASGLMSTLAKYGGNAPLTPDQAVAYADFSNKIAEQYAETDRLAYSPLDPTNNNTFMGKIVAQLIPYASKMASLSGILSSVASISMGSFSSVLSSQTTKAASTDDYTMCQDLDYNNLDGHGGSDGNNPIRLATDPFCNVMYGIPPTALNADPVSVANTLLNEGQIDPNTGDPIGSDYTTFISNCINRDRPLGDSGQNFTEDDGSGCLFGAKTAAGYPNDNYYIHYIDQRVKAGMDGQ